MKNELFAFPFLKEMQYSTKGENFGLFSLTIFCCASDAHHASALTASEGRRSILFDQLIRSPFFNGALDFPIENRARSVRVDLVRWMTMASCHPAKKAGFLLHLDTECFRLF